MAEESWKTPTLVQDLAIKVQQAPSRYVQPEQYHPISLVVGAETPESIPVVDLSRLSAADGVNEAIKQLRLALQSWGVFLVANHGIETSLMDDLINASREFFHQPLEEKQKYSNVIDGKQIQLEGYGNDLVKFEGQTLDWSDRLYLKVKPEDERNLSLWPKHPKSFRAVLHEYTLNCERIKDCILRAMAKALGLDEGYFVSHFTSGKAPTFARFNYYPPCPRPDLVFGIKPHSDAGVLTVILMDKDVGGLQILRDGKWHNVPTSPHRLLINLGDCTEIMSNGIFKSPTHRAVTNAENERISLAMFHGLDPEKEIEPAADLLHEEPSRYRKVKVKEYLAGFFERFSRGTRFIDSVKI